MSQSGSKCFFTVLSPHVYEPTTHGIGPWSKDALHGGPPLALAIHELLGANPVPDMTLANVHCDLYGPVPLAPLAFTTTLLRPGKRVALIETTACSGDRTILRALGWQIHTESNRIPTNHRLPVPSFIPSRCPVTPIDAFPCGDAIEWRFEEGSFSTPGPAKVYATPKIPLLSTGEVSPQAIAGLIADFANGLAAELSFDAFMFVPPVIDMSFLRVPAAPPLGVSARTFVHNDGIGLTHATLFDEQGVFAYVSQTLYLDNRQS